MLANLSNMGYFVNCSHLMLVNNVISSENISNKNIENIAPGLHGSQAMGISVGLGVIIALAIIFNVFVIFSVFKYKPLKIPKNMFLVSLASADISVAIFVMPFNLIYTILGKWLFGLYICKFWLTCRILCCTASILNLCAIALDRYWAVNDSINYIRKRTMKRVFIMIFCVWLFSIIIAIPPLLGWNDWPEVFTSGTSCQLTKREGYIVYSAIGFFIIPLIIMIFAYGKIFKIARRRIRVKTKVITDIITNLDSARSSPCPSRSLCNILNHDVTLEVATSNSMKMEERLSTPHSQNFLIVPKTNLSTGISSDKISNESDNKAENFEKISPAPSIGSIDYARSYMEGKLQFFSQKERKAAQTLGVIIGIFLLCWVPFSVMYITLAFCESCYPSEKMILCITWLAYFNSALNPIIYTVLNDDFRKSLYRLMCKRTQPE